MNIVAPAGFGAEAAHDGHALNADRLTTDADTVLGEIGSLQARLTANEDELEASQRLRYRVFCDEMGAIAGDTGKSARRDEDEFDAICDHLIVLDTGINGKTTDQIVGTYRLLRDEVAREHGGFYSGSEYDISALVERHPGKRFLELGRSCVLPGYRSKRTIELLWQGIWAYCLRHEIAVMVGCASFHGAVPARHALPLSFLNRHAGACALWDAKPVASNSVSMDMMPIEAVDMKAALSAMPPLIKGYLRLGAKFASSAVIDTTFGTTDVFVILPVATISGRYVRYYGADAGRFAPGSKTA
jgi:L-ornithine Nalpha-acyltransferase